MLEPRESDVPALFLVLVVFPLVAYFLLGKWSEAAKKRERIGLLAQLASEEAFREEEMAVPDVIPSVPLPKSGLHLCARCLAPAKTRCSGCKAVRYCSGNCQIIHWRQIHKQECQQSATNRASSSPLLVSDEETFHMSVSVDDNMNSQLFEKNMQWAMAEEAPSENSVYPARGTSVSATSDGAPIRTSHVSTFGRRTSRKPIRETLRKENGAVPDSCIESIENKATKSTSFNTNSSKEVFREHKSRNNDYNMSGIETSKRPNDGIPSPYVYGQAASSGSLHKGDNSQSQHCNVFVSRSNGVYSTSSHSAKNGMVAHEFEIDMTPKGGNMPRVECHTTAGLEQFNQLYEMKLKEGTVKSKSLPRPPGIKKSKLPKSISKASEDLSCFGMEKGLSADESKVMRMRDTFPASVNNSGVASSGIMKLMSLKKSKKLSEMETENAVKTRHKKVKMLFPYDEFVKLFQSEVFDIQPRGLLNCGNSCYANAVLQCLTCTRPLVIYLLCRSHSKTCYGKDWCLMCELEQHIMMLREIGGPISPSRILLHMRSITCQMGNGNQEDAHEFLRLLIASMQSIFLEGHGGENKVDPRLQETTFIQHTFGGRLKSKVMCLRCGHESERYENIMDLTLEIYGWVESLEDALTQFTTAEDLDGENMYRCPRCASYVRARKQLSIHEAPNILTIVLKRFQEGQYGKINKCISFPDMLDMIPFMTGAGDMPPLYMLYGAVVHLDMLNASFSGHYVSYVKDLRGCWFRIDDTEVQPVQMSQVMSEGAYILFYMRSCPRPQVTVIGKSGQQRVGDPSKQCTEKAEKTSKTGHGREGNQYVGLEISPGVRQNNVSNFVDNSKGILRRGVCRNILPVTETYGDAMGREFLDATSSDWSLFTSSDDASFTTESTRDSFSTVDYADACNMDPITSFFNYAPEYRKNSSCRKFSNSRPLTRYFQPSERVESTNVNSVRNPNPHCNLSWSSDQCNL